MLGLILPYKGIMPTIGKNVFIAHNAAVMGDVVLGDSCNIWFSCVVRGDVNKIRIGKNTNIQDGTIVHCSSQEGGETIIGDDVTVGHMACIHACTLEDNSFVGIGAKVLDGAYVESGGMVAACALLTSGKRVKKGEMWAGVPAKPIREIGEKEMAMMKRIPGHYVELGEDYMKGEKGA